MDWFKKLDAFEADSLQQAQEENVLCIRKATPVAKVIDQAAEEIQQNAYQSEQQASYSWIPGSVVPEFKGTRNGLAYRGNLVSNFYYEIVKMEIILSSGSGCRGYYMTIKVHMLRNGQESTQMLHHVTKEQLESPELLNKIPLATGSSKITKSDLKHILYSYASHLITNFSGEIVYVTQATGWVCFQGRWLYVDAEKALGEPELLIHANGNLRINNSLQVANLWEEYQKMRKVLRGKGQMDALLLYVQISFLFTLYQEAGKTTKHCMFLVGERATRKTALALCFSQLENKETPVFNFLATESGIQSHFNNYHDSCILVDDLAPSCSSAKRNSVEQKLEMLIRLFGDAGKRVINPFFAKTSADNLDYSVKGGALITGEYFYSTGVESSIARTIVLELEKDSVDLKHLTYFQKNPEILETLLYRFLVFISQRWEESKKLIVEMTEYYRLQYQSTFSNGRYADYMGQYMAQANLLALFFQYESGLSEGAAKSFCNQIQEDISYLLMINERKMLSRAPVNTLLLSIIYMTEIGRVVSWGQSIPQEEAWLIENDSAYYVRQKDLPDILRMYCSKTGEPYTKMTSQELGKLLNQAEICTVYHEGGEVRLAKKYTKDYGTARLMELSKEKIISKVGALINR